MDPRSKGQRRDGPLLPTAEDEQCISLRMYDDDLHLEEELEIAYFEGGFQGDYIAALQVPFHLLKGIDIDVVPPFRISPTDVVVLWAMIMSIVVFFADDRLPNVHIKFISDRPEMWASWANEDGSLRPSLDIPPQFQSDALDPKISDVEIALLQFRKLRLQLGSKISISLPTGARPSTSVARLIREIEDGATKDADNEPGTVIAQSQQNAWSIYLDLQLDTMANHMPHEAPMIRLVRFDTIGHDYFANIHEWIERESKRDYVSKNLLDAATSALELRHAALLAYKPWAEGNTELYDQYQQRIWISDVEWRWNRIKDEFLGVPSFTSNEFIGFCLNAWPIFHDREHSFRLRKRLEDAEEPFNPEDIFGLASINSSHVI